MTQATAARIRFRCKHCKTAHAVPHSWAGRKGRCPTCKARCRIPGGACRGCGAKAAGDQERCRSCRLGRPVLEHGPYLILEGGILQSGELVCEFADLSSVDVNTQKTEIRVQGLPVHWKVITELRFNFFDRKQDPVVIRRIKEYAEEDREALTVAAIAQSHCAENAEKARRLAQADLARNKALRFGALALSRKEMQLRGLLGTTTIPLDSIGRVANDGEFLRFFKIGATHFPALKVKRSKVERRSELKALLADLLVGVTPEEQAAYERRSWVFQVAAVSLAAVPLVGILAAGVSFLT